VLARTRSTAAQFILLYGRRRVGETVLLRHWAENSGWWSEVCRLLCRPPTDATLAEAEAVGAALVDLERLDADLRGAVEKA
jgi:hypothetical protein